VIGEGRLEKAAIALLALSGVLLMGVGVFTEDYDPITTYSRCRTSDIPSHAGRVLISLYKTRALGRIGFLVSACACFVGALLLPMGGTPQSETLAVLAMVVWGLLMVFAALLKESGRPIP